MSTRHAHPNPPVASGSSLGLTLVLLWIAVGSLVPFVPADSWSQVAFATKEGMTLSIREPTILTLSERLATFLPVGLLVYWKLSQRARRRQHLASCLGVALFAAAIEIAQAATQARHARLSDFLLAVAAGLVGLALGVRLTPYRMRLRAYWVRYHRVLAACAVLFGNVIALSAIVLAHRGVEIAGWDRSYPLLVANELTHDRPWRGRIRGVAIYARGLTGEEIQRLSGIPMVTENADLRDQAGAIALYLFGARSGERVPQRAGGGVELELQLPQPGPATWRPADGSLDIRGPITIRSVGPASEICDAIETSQALTVEVQAASSDPTQSGPARIVSISASPYLRNLTLGQEQRDLVLRVRTPRNGPNGMRIPLRTDTKPLTDSWHHIVARYAHGTAALYVDDTPACPPLNCSSVSVLLFRRDSAASTVMVAGSLLFAVGLATFLLASRAEPRKLFMCLCAAGLAPVLLSLSLAAYLGHSHDAAFVASAVAGPFFGLIVGRVLGRHR